MHSKYKNRLARMSVIGTILISTGNASLMADGFRNPPSSSSGIAKGGANSVFVEDSSAVAYNPANLALIQTADSQLNVALAYSELSWKNAAIEAESEWVALPSVFSAIPVGENGLVFGLGITTPYGQGVTWDRSGISAAYPLAIYEAQMQMVNISPALAMPVTSNLVVGVALDIAYSTLELKQNISGVLPYDIVGHADVSGAGVGAHAGITWLITEKQRVALTCQSPIYIKYEGDFTIEDDGGALGGAFDGDLETSIKFPTIIKIGYGVQLSDALQLEAQVEWLQWSLYNKANFKSSSVLANQVLAQNWNDTWTFAVGGSYKLSEAWTLSFGYAFIESPIPDETYAPSFPDSDRHVISSGVGFNQGGHCVDVSYAYSIFDDRTASGSPYSGNYEIAADLVGLTYKYTF
jgi:long-chain fatty acid transport protein